MKKFFLFFLMLFSQQIFACQCPVVQWSKDLADENEVIFRGVIKNIFFHQNNFTIAEFEVKNLFKGSSSPSYKVLFPENDECAVHLNIGEEWLIYGEQKQINSCEIEWCGLSRKKFQNDAEDFFIATHIITYDEEFQKLEQNFPEIKLNDTNAQEMFHKNIIPSRLELYIYLALSLILFLLILNFTKKYLK